MKILYFGNFMNLAQTREDSVVTKIWFKNNVWAVNGAIPKTTFEWESTCTINEVFKSIYDGLVLDLSNLKGNHAFERQYITRMVLRKIDDNPKIFFLCMNEYTFECLKSESIKDLTKISNLFVRDTKKNEDVRKLQEFLGLAKKGRFAI